MYVDLISDDASFARLEPKWDELVLSDPLGFFRRFAWQYSWWKNLGGGRRLRLLVAGGKENPRGFFPLFEEQRHGARRLALIGSGAGGSDYLDAPARDPLALDALIRGATRLGADLIELEDLDSESPLVSRIRSAAAAAGSSLTVVPRYPCHLIPIDRPWEEYLQEHKRRETLGRRQRWLAAQPGFRIEHRSDPEHVPDFFSRFLHLHAERWREAGGSEAFADRRLASFHAQVLENLASQGALRMWTLWVAGNAVAVAYGFEHQRRSLYYQSGFLPAWGARSVGLVLFAAFVKDAFDRQLEVVDLLRGDELYKSEWASRSRQTLSLVWPLTPRGRAALALRRFQNGARHKLRESLPAPMRLGLSRAIREARLKGQSSSTALAARLWSGLGVSTFRPSGPG